MHHPTCTSRPCWPVAIALAVLCTMLAAGCDRIITVEVDPREPPLNEIIELTRTGGDLPLIANGLAEDTLVARIPANATLRVITFTTSAGTFLLKPGAKEIKVRAEQVDDPHDDRLVARTVLVADTLPGRAVVSASVGDFTAYLFVPFVQ